MIELQRALKRNRALLVQLQQTIDDLQARATERVGVVADATVSDEVEV